LPSLKTFFIVALKTLIVSIIVNAPLIWLVWADLTGPYIEHLVSNPFGMFIVSFLMNLITVAVFTYFILGEIEKS